MTQISNLVLLAPAIQEAILEWPAITAGRDPVTERTLRSIVAEPAWEIQAEHWRAHLPALERRTNSGHVTDAARVPRRASPDPGTQPNPEHRHAARP
jgi:hypothetical protein